MTRLKRYYDDLACRIAGRKDMNLRNWAHHRDLAEARAAAERWKAYETVLYDLLALMPKFELPWKAAAKRYRERMLNCKATIARLERELRNAYEARDRLAGRPRCAGKHSEYEYCAECDG